MQGNHELFKLLKEIDPSKPYGTELFNALARLTVSVAVEAVCIRKTVNIFHDISSAKIYLTQRSLQESAYPGKWHCPGSVMRPGESVDDVMVRLSKREFGAKLTSWKFVNNFNHPQEERGHFLSLVYLCELEEKNDEKDMCGKWFCLPWELSSSTVVQHHLRYIIPMAMKEFFKKT